jgi:hypothetical protein
MHRMFIVLALFVIFTLTQGTYLSTVPGLMGDEASEGQNVIELWEGQKPWLEGERSYIGPLMDYVRMPFVWIFGHTVLALRLVTFCISVASFWLGIAVFNRLFGRDAALLTAAVVFFSPQYISQQRISWAITLIPFFALLLIYSLIRVGPHRALLGGIVAGLGLHTHFVFLPTLGGILLAASAAWGRRIWTLLRWWPLLLGFWAAFATQAAILVTSSAGDQGEPTEVVALMRERLTALPSALPLLISGSSYIARYTGEEFSLRTSQLITAGVVTLAVIGLAFARPRHSVWQWAGGLAIQLALLLLIIDRFTLRYFVAPTLATWVLAGVGVACLLSTFQPKAPRLYQLSPVIVAVLLTSWSVVAILRPFQATGGSVNRFSLGNRTDSASALVAIDPLIACLAGQGPVWSENVHIYNRLRYLSYSQPKLTVAESAEEARWLVDYRLTSEPGTLCPELAHFVIREPSEEDRDK